MDFGFWSIVKIHIKKRKIAIINIFPLCNLFFESLRRRYEGIKGTVVGDGFLAYSNPSRIKIKNLNFFLFCSIIN